jgi:hypothetical protein
MNTNKSSPYADSQMKKAYVKPQVEKISLLINESVLSTGCKASNINGPYDPGDPVVPCTTYACINNGT